MNKPHKHAELMMEYAKDAMETDSPWERWEYTNGSENGWVVLEQHPQWYADGKYRRKPRTININGIEVPEPYRGDMEYDTKYYFPRISKDRLFDWYCWQNDQQDIYLRESGLLHLTEEAAIKHAEALLSFTKQQ